MRLTRNLRARRIGLLGRSFNESAAVKEKYDRQRVAPAWRTIGTQPDGLCVAFQIYVLNFDRLFDID
ncbi:hypothetical protein [Paraburkholderia caribensis]|uniref:hypothetical protein n=1 Tax=Paraburkholderia caribensis TaxID=75105 RepID=UPI001F2DABDA|nr:hypothetical protein [Paraburkholderia caribensis]